MRSSLLSLLLFTGCSSSLEIHPLEDTFLPDDAPGGDTDGPGEPIDTDPAAPGANEPPVADAGDDLAALVTDVVALDGGGSYDPDGDTLAYTWTFRQTPPGSSSNLINETRPNPSFFVDAPGTYVIELVVDDGEETDADEVVVEATSPNSGPVANAGPDQTVDVGDTVQLNGSGSYDPDLQKLTYAWVIASKPAGSGAALDDPSSVLPRFTADVAGTYLVDLTVLDDGGTTWSPKDTVRVTAQASDDSDCISCLAAQVEIQRRLRAGDVAASFGLVLLPLLVAFAQRRDPR